jgi:hypothetical protein
LKRMIGQSLMNPKAFYKVQEKAMERAAPAKPLTALESLKLALREKYLNRQNQEVTIFIYCCLEKS